MKKFVLLGLGIVSHTVLWGIGPLGQLRPIMSSIQSESEPASTYVSFTHTTSDTTYYRDPYTWPFSKKSIWNTPVGSKAEYVHAHIQAATAYCPQADEEVIVTTPYEKPMVVFYSDAGFSEKNRCEKTDNTVMMNVPIPVDFFVDPPGTPNMAAAILGEDKYTLFQTQPFAKCVGNDYATSLENFPSVDLFGLGIEGAHKGSGLSSIGGSIRLGELVPGGRIRHALKCSVSGASNLYYSKETKGYRWPASMADEDASTTYGTSGDPVMDCRMGALLAIPYWMDIDTMGFQTEAGLIIARVCQEYGMYIVDDSNSDTYKICTEISPDGRVETEFEENWGYTFTQHENEDHPWRQDVNLLFTHLHVISNNSIDYVGGGGEFLAPEAPDFYKTYKLSISTKGADGAEVSPLGTSDVIHGEEIPIKVLSVPPGYMFEQWEVSSGEALIADPDSIATTVTLSAGNAEIVAVFAIQTFNMTIYTVGSGSVEKNPDQENYIPGSEVNLVATADSGWIFTAWSGDLEDTRNPLEIIIDQDISITATFEKDVTSIKRNLASQLENGEHKVSIRYDPQASQLLLKSVKGDLLTTLWIYNLQGMLVHKEDLSNQKEASMSIQSLPPGYYLVKIQLEHGLPETYRFLKE